MARAPDEIARTIPYLRRYARALTGSQVLGDQYVGISLEVIGDDPQRMFAGGNPRREIFRTFHQLWAKTTPAGESADRIHGEARAWDFIGGATRRERQLLLLVAVEGCSLIEAAYILGIEEAEARALLGAASRAAARHARAPILIIEDEPLIAMDLESIVEAAGYRVCGVATREDEALDLAQGTAPRLILADVRLKDGHSGVAAVRKILCSLDIPVVFITGYPGELLTGMTPEPAFVITKPFKSETVLAAVSQALLADLPAEPDAAWRLRGRTPEEAEAARVQAPAEEEDHARRADTSRP